MRYQSFRIRNWKGIQDTVVALEVGGPANVFALVGLNESGKTTILEAIHSFSPTDATSELLGGSERIGVPFSQRVPRHRISDFTGDVSVEATLCLSDEERCRLAGDIDNELGIQIESGQLPPTIRLERHQRFKDGDFQNSYFSLRTPITGKTGKQKKFRSLTASETIDVRDFLYKRAPVIAYFPTFVFNFPNKIYLSDRGDVVDRFYRRVFQDILDYDGRGNTIEKDIIRRVREPELQVPWVGFFNLWSKKDHDEKIRHVMDRASAAVTKLVFGKWNEIFGEEVKGKEIEISYQIEEGHVEDASGNLVATQAHDVSVQFRVKDGTRRFFVNDRSLGFRWFFFLCCLRSFALREQGRKIDPPFSCLTNQLQIYTRLHNKNCSTRSLRSRWANMP